MSNPFSKSLMAKLTALFLVASLLPMVIVGWLSYQSSKAALEHGAFVELEATRDVHKQAVTQFLRAIAQGADTLATTSEVKTAIAKVDEWHESQGGTTNTAAMNVTNEEYQALYNNVAPFFEKFVKIYGYHDLFLMDAYNGHVMFSIAKESDLGTSLSAGVYKDSGLARLWAKVVRERRTTFVDYSHYAPSDQPAMFAGAPIFDDTGDLLGVVALQVSTADLGKIVQQGALIGETGETILVGEDLLMRSDSRFESDSTILKRTVDTIASRAALEGKVGSDFFEDYRGVPALLAYSPMGLEESLGVDFDWAIIGKIDEREAFAAVRALLLRVFWVGGVVGFLASVVGYFAARGIAGPIRRVADLAVKVGEGDLAIDVTSLSKKRADEVGILAESFRIMVENLRTQTGEIGEAVNVLSSAGSEIASSIAQVTTGATETATAVTETSTTVEELKQTADVAAEKAQRVSESAKQATATSQKGLGSTEQVRDKMDRIKQQMDAIGESVMSLSEQSQAIGEIIATVDDLAEQSNLLSVNASVEAAKAGEQGKGFAVVAQEIKNMAEGSKEATKQVRSILSDIQKATGATVMASEQGSKAVEEGAEQTSEAARAIRALASNVEEAAQASVQIAASSRQQSTGVEQVSAAMQNVKQASEQNADSMKQLDAAAHNLQDVAHKLAQLVAQWKV